jgi:hypothetical protein
MYHLPPPPPLPQPTSLPWACFLALWVSLPRYLPLLIPGSRRCCCCSPPPSSSSFISRRSAFLLPVSGYYRCCCCCVVVLSILDIPLLPPPPTGLGTYELYDPPLPTHPLLPTYTLPAAGRVLLSILPLPLPLYLSYAHSHLLLLPSLSLPPHRIPTSRRIPTYLRTHPNQRKKERKIPSESRASFRCSRVVVE